MRIFQNLESSQAEVKAYLKKLTNELEGFSVSRDSDSTRSSRFAKELCLCTFNVKATLKQKKKQLEPFHTLFRNTQEEVESPTLPKSEPMFEELKDDSSNRPSLRKQTTLTIQSIRSKTPIKRTRDKGLSSLTVYNKSVRSKTPKCKFSSLIVSDEMQHNNSKEEEQVFQEEEQVAAENDQEREEGVGHVQNGAD